MEDQYLDSYYEDKFDLGNDCSECEHDEPERDEPDDVPDAQADSEWLASAGMGTDEDYNHYSYEE